MHSIGLSFMAGLALNFMPCVLPILLIKIYDIIGAAENKKNLKIVSLSSTLGIISVFIFFASISMTFKYLGKNLNLGFHFQNPYFLGITIAILFLFLLNLLNVFDIHYSAKFMGYLQNKYEKLKNHGFGIFFESFLTAIFMVLFATPCSIPIIGTIATLILPAESYFLIFLNFLAMGAGMSVPFILILVYPNLLGFLKNRKNLLSITKNIIIVALTLTIVWLSYTLLSSRKQEFKNDIAIEEIEKYIGEGKTVFVSITAKWCMVCNLNEVGVISRNEIQRFLDKHNVVRVEIDITQDSSRAEKFYKNPNNIYVPKYIIYNRNNPDGCDFTGQITKKDFLGKLEKSCR